MQFNKEQERAVAHGEGPMLVLAGPGSGKTTVITGRVEQLIESGQAESGILVVTFTRASAREMRERFLKRRGRSSTAVTFGTFHGVFFGILRNSIPTGAASVIGEEEKLRLLKEILRQHYPSGDQEGELPSLAAREISQVKSRAIDLAHYYSGIFPHEVFRRVYQSYERRKVEAGKLDFDDIIVRCHRLLTERPDILRAWQRKFRYILIDEFQDISPMQYEIVRMLALPENNLFIVGDDDQSIYRFRGASPSIMLHFPQDYPDTARVTLEENYRSTPEILDRALMLVGKNRTRYRKKIRAVCKSGSPVRVRVFDNPHRECSGIAEEIRRRHERGEAYGQMAVLARTNPGCRVAMEQMTAWQIPFRANEPMPGLYSHWIARDIMAYMDIAAGSQRRSDYLRIYNRPNRYFSREAFSDRLIRLDDLYDFYEDKEWMCQRVDQLEADLSMIGRLPPYGAVQYIRNQVEYEKYVREYALEHRIETEELVRILDELCDSARPFQTLGEWRSMIESYEKKRMEQLQRRSAEDEEGVLISTLHGAKGLEFDLVYILDVNEGIIPYHKACLEEDLEEERRMLYVGMTRARRELELCLVRERYEKRMEPSSCLRECGIEVKL